MLLACACILGAVVGSFVNVCIWRLPAGESIVSPPSHCPHCGHRIRAYDNIPILSYLLLGGRCRACRTRISARYPAVEALTAAGFAPSPFPSRARRARSSGCRLASAAWSARPSTITR